MLESSMTRHDTMFNALPLGTIAFRAPQYLSHVSTAWVEHIPFAFWIMEAHRPKAFVELGTHAGDSYLAFCQAVAELAMPTTCYAVDTWQGDEHAGLYGDAILKKLSEYHDPRYSAFSHLVRSTFDEAVSHFGDGEVDLLHIDGLHTYEAVKHDYDTWRPKLSNQAVVLFHDINVRERGFGVYRLWQELSEQFPNFSFTHGHGLGVLGVGNALPAPVLDLLEASQDEDRRHTIREVFSRLGRAAIVQVRLHQMQNEIDRLNATQASMDSEIEYLRIALPRLFGGRGA
jgi:hypothetical protein